MIIDDDLWPPTGRSSRSGNQRPIMQQRYKNHDVAAAATRSKRINIGKINFVVCGWTDLQRHREEQNVQTSQIYIFPLRLLQKILLIGVVQALMSAVGKQMTKETGTSAANACSLQRSCGRSGRTCYMVFCNLRVQNIDNDVDGVAVASSGRKI